MLQVIGLYLVITPSKSEVISPTINVYREPFYCRLNVSASCRSQKCPSNVLILRWHVYSETILVWSPHAGELQERRNSSVSEVCPSWKRLRAKFSAPGEGGCEREGCSSLVRLSEGKSPIPQWRAERADDRPEVHHLEPSVQERRGLELREVPHRTRWSAIQAIQQEVPHQWHRGRHQEAPRQSKLKIRPQKCFHRFQTDSAL